MNYQETLQYLYDRLPVFHLVGSTAYKPGLDNTYRLMTYLDNPHQKFHSVHIAGTNGKGSVSHYMAAILQEAGYKVGLYTSPHLVDFGERIRVNGQMINQKYVINFIKKNIETIETIQPSFFELTMAMAFSYFADMKVDIAVIEVGLGGRLDSTNIITPILSIITNIGFDHVDFLGNTLSQIAAEKAGIIKSGVPVVIGETLPETKPVFMLKSTEMEADVFFAEEDDSPDFIYYEQDKMLFSYHQQEYYSGLTGLYQLKNLATVFMASKVIQDRTTFSISPEALRKGIKDVCQITGLRGRWELLQSEPKVVADTCHNVQGIQAIVNQLKFQHYKTLRIVIGMVHDKDITGVLALLPEGAVYYFTHAQVKRALPAVELRNKAEGFNLSGKAFELIKDAVGNAITEADKEDLILITGSNFVVGEALTLF
ncbi:MAG: bifunctional folylpolyglutamate synthase/dihydrofolate synthase [Paludibacter sp.]|nr:bifunctional folylpolyglutamate synthase/dihydrofolate synthase [Paludibacter sp.]MDD4197868.1 bifunctional folylpolyglutamate synthase/dihydrofolate synthase [Paludibacter sp.]MDD4428142.1 bifunctional folylpolyglutamate synthase/dihydrofolate synthase [Paludibacter sp.]